MYWFYIRFTEFFYNNELYNLEFDVLFVPLHHKRINSTVMIAEFSIENFFSIKSVQKISFVPSSDTFMSDEYSYEVKEGVRLLKLGIIYGANASGKTNILNAIQFFNGQMNFSNLLFITLSKRYAKIRILSLSLHRLSGQSLKIKESALYSINHQFKKYKQGTENSSYRGLLICVFVQAFGDAFEVHGWQPTFYN